MFKGHVFPTIELTMLAIIFAVFFAVVLAVLGSIWPRSFVDRLVTFTASLGMAVPTFVTAIILLLVFGLWWPILPTRGYISFTENPLQNLKLVAMPTMTLSFCNGANLEIAASFFGRGFIIAMDKDG